MFARWSERLIRLSSGRATLVALIVFLAFTALVLPGLAASSAERTGGARQPDTSLFYTAADLYAMAEAFGPAGRQAYIGARFTFDLVWPLVYGTFLVTAISWLAGRVFRPDAGQALGRRLNLLPILGVALDYLENISTTLVMAGYPAQTPIIDALAGVFTLVKWLLVGGSCVALVALAIAALAQRAQGR